MGSNTIDFSVLPIRCAEILKWEVLNRLGKGGEPQNHGKYLGSSHNASPNLYGLKKSKLQEEFLYRFKLLGDFNLEFAVLVCCGRCCSRDTIVYIYIYTTFFFETRILSDSKPPTTNQPHQITWIDPAVSQILLP